MHTIEINENSDTADYILYLTNKINQESFSESIDDEKIAELVQKATIEDRSDMIKTLLEEHKDEIKSHLFIVCCLIGCDAGYRVNQCPKVYLCAIQFIFYPLRNLQWVKDNYDVFGFE